MAGEFSPELTLLAWLGTFGAAVAGLTAFILNGFSSNRKYFRTEIDKLIKRMDRIDAVNDRRFNVVDDKLWEIMWRNSRKDGRPPPRTRPLAQVVRDFEREESEQNGQEGTDSRSAV